MSTSTSAGMADARQRLRTVFGHADFRPAQAEAIRAALSGRDVLIVMPTGSGKSLCYQLPALVGEPPGLTLVVSPLVALMQDQVATLRARGVAAAALHGCQPAAETAAALRAAARGQLRLLYVAPERIAGSPDVLTTLAGAPVRRLVVDEAHCVVHWGPDFRPDYLRLNEALPALGEPQLIALTATATRSEQGEIARALGRPRARRVVAGFDRPEIFFAVQPVARWSDKLRAVVRAVKSAGGAAVVYTASRHEAETVARTLADQQRWAAAAYHAGLPGAVRTAVQAAFMAGRVRVVVATSAFGMGIDKPDIRAVVHWSLPFDLTEYMQAVGRAGRDGRPALALLLASRDDERLRLGQIGATAPTAADYSAVCLALAMGAGAADGIDPDQTARRAGLAPVTARAALAHLQHAGIARSIGGGAGSWALVRGATPRDLADLANRAAARSVAREAAFAEVARFAAGSDCRRASLVARFTGEPPEARAPCCDVCRRASEPVRTSPRARTPRSPSSGTPRMVDRGQQPSPTPHPPPSLSRELLALVAAGRGLATLPSLTRAVCRPRPDRPTPPAPSDVASALNRLVEARLVAVHHGSQPPRWALSSRGRDQLTSDRVPMAR